MQQSLKTLLRLFGCLLLALTFSAAAEDAKVDPTGTWTWSFAGRDGQTRETTLKLKLDGDKLTGSISGRQGQDDIAIQEGKIKGEEISFKITREFNGNSFTQKYAGKVSGDSIKGKIEMDRGGETRSRDWEAKRAPAKK